MRNNEPDASEEIHALIGRIVASLLKPDSVVCLHEITEALHRLCNSTDSAEARALYLKAIDVLTRKMH